MAEAFYMRAKRVVSDGIEGTLDKVERASGTSLMRQAIREVDRAIDKVQREIDDAIDRKVHAASQQQSTLKDAKSWGEKAAFTLAKGRDDLTEGALSRQLDLEAQSKQFEDIKANSKKEAERLGETLTALKARRDEMNQELIEFEKAVRETQLGGTEKADFERSIERKVDNAQRAFERSMGLVAEVEGSNIDSAFAKNAAEIDKLQRDSEIEERMAALKKSSKTKGK